MQKQTTDQQVIIEKDRYGDTKTMEDKVCKYLKREREGQINTQETENWI